MASIERTPAGTWRTRWRDDTGRGRAKTFKRKADAQRFAADVLNGDYIAPYVGNLTVAAWADTWLTGALSLGQGGRDTYRRDLDRYILPALGDVPLRRLTAERIDIYLAAELEAGLAASTVHRHYRTLRRMAQVAVERQRLVRNPCDLVTPPRPDHREMRFLTPAQVDALAEAISPRYRAWVYVACYAGLRWSETVGLRRAHVQGDRITVTEQLIRRADREWHRDPPKTRAGRRVVGVPAFLADELTAHLAVWSQPGPDGLVFPNRGGRPMNNPSFRGTVFSPALRRAGIAPGLRIHDLRHTAVALAVAAGAHPKAIQARHGHASITVTLDRYGHLFPEADATVATRLDALRRLGGLI